MLRHSMTFGASRCIRTTASAATAQRSYPPVSNVAHRSSSSLTNANERAKQPIGSDQQEQIKSKPRPRFSTLHALDNAVPLHADSGGLSHNPATSSQEAEVTSLDFDSPASAHGTKTTTELLRGILVYTMCRFQPLVDNASVILSLSRKIFGDTVTDAIIRETMFKQFCAGEDRESIRPKIEWLRRENIGSILDYAAENEGGDDDEGGDGSDEGIVSHPPYNQPARLYAYKDEDECDRHVETFVSCIRSVRDVSPDGFAALKVTALGNPLLLERLSTAIVEAKKLLAQFDIDRDGIVTKDEFADAYRTVFTDADDKLPELLCRLDPFDKNEIDYIEWSKLLTPADLPRITASCREIGPLALACPSEEEIQLMEAMHGRLRTLADEAEDCGVRLLIDAEQVKFQPAIDNLVLDLQQHYNAFAKTEFPIIFHTYQCYLKDALLKIQLDMERSRRYSYHFAAKLVRGAYMTSERQRATEMEYEDPIHGSAKDTHTMYDDAVEYLVRMQAESNVSLEFMCATHNKRSIENAIDLMKKYGIKPGQSTVQFAQLLGMSDNLTHTLGSNGYHAYKYVPYGKVNEVMPYLLRRAQENNAILGDSSKETRLLFGEFKRRLLM